MNSLEKLSQVLEKRAGQQLDRDLAALFKFATDSGLDLNRGPQLTFQLYPLDATKQSKPVSLYFILMYEKPVGADYYKSSSFMDEFRAEMLPIYRDYEIKAFVEKVDRLDLQEPDEK